jgi:hypothetical protein
MRTTAMFDGVPVVSTTELCSRLGLKISSTDLKALAVAQPFAETSTGIYWREDDVFLIAMELSASLARRAGTLELERLATKYPRQTASA